MRLTAVEEIASGTRAYYFERPADFDFVAGQFVEMSLEDMAPSDPFRSFSIASAPSESHLMIATRSRDSAFKQALSALAPASEVQIDGPYGKFGLRDDARLAHVLIAGGIGITPFRSMLIQAAAAGGLESLLLFHANRDISGAPFTDEMARLSQQAPGFRFIPTLTRPSEGWNGETGYVDAAMLSRYVDSNEAIFYVSGPPAMVQSTRKMLADIAVPADRIASESFEGY